MLANVADWPATVVASLVGGVLALAGAITAQVMLYLLSQRTESRRHRRDLYASVLGNLGQQIHNLQLLSNLEMWSSTPGFRTSMIDELQARLDRRQAKHDELLAELYRNTAIARLFASSDAGKVLQQLSIPSYEVNRDMPVEERRKQVESVLTAILAVGRKDLGVND